MTTASSEKVEKAAVKMKTAKVKLSEIVLDFGIYPRAQVDAYHVREIMDAVQGGAMLPLILLDAVSKRVVDGAHRLTAYRRLYGPDESINVSLKTYASEREMFEDAMRFNAQHGRNLTIYDKARCITIGETLGLTNVQVAAVLHMTLPRVTEVRAQRFSEDGTLLKATMRHFAGASMTDGQKEYGKRAGGLDQLFYLRQVVGLIESGSVDWSRDSVVDEMKKLSGLLKEALKGK